jgi:hypothetical protein
VGWGGEELEGESEGDGGLGVRGQTAGGGYVVFLEFGFYGCGLLGVVLYFCGFFQEGGDEGQELEKWLALYLFRFLGGEGVSSVERKGDDFGNCFLLHLPR